MLPQQHCQQEGSLRQETGKGLLSMPETLLHCVLLQRAAPPRILPRAELLRNNTATSYSSLSKSSQPFLRPPSTQPVSTPSLHPSLLLLPPNGSELQVYLSSTFPGSLHPASGSWQVTTGNVYRVPARGRTHPLGMKG